MILSVKIEKLIGQRGGLQMSNIELVSGVQSVAISAQNAEQELQDFTESGSRREDMSEKTVGPIKEQ